MNHQNIIVKWVEQWMLHRCTLIINWLKKNFILLYYFIIHIKYIIMIYKSHIDLNISTTKL